MRDNYDFSKAKRGKTVAREIKIVKTFRLDVEVLEWLDKEGAKQGMGYQTFLNWFLQKSMKAQPSLEERIEKLEEIVLKKKK